MVHVRTGILAGGYIRGEIVFRDGEKDVGAMFGVRAAGGRQAYTQKHGLRVRCRASALLDLKVRFRSPRGLRNGREYVVSVAAHKLRRAIDHHLRRVSTGKIEGVNVIPLPQSKPRR